MKNAVVLAATLACLALPAGYAVAQTSDNSNWHYKTANKDWTWMEDYVFIYANYTVACETGRSCQVGMGIFAFGEPRGEKIRFTDQKEILTIGGGALYIRADDGKGPVKVAFIRREIKLVPIIDMDF